MHSLKHVNLCGQHPAQINNYGKSLDGPFTLYLAKLHIFRDLGPWPPLDTMYACMHKKEGTLENKKIFKLKNEGYNRDDIKRKETR